MYSANNFKFRLNKYKTWQGDGIVAVDLSWRTGTLSRIDTIGILNFHPSPTLKRR